MKYKFHDSDIEYPTVSKAVEKEKLRLATENSKLQNEIDDLKTRLSIAELQNGKPQVCVDCRSVMAYNPTYI